MKYGFVYIWYDRKHKRYYIGAHWGTEVDGYICSSSWMKQAYTKRARDFKRRILARVYTSRQDMFNEEAKWQSLIKDEELCVKYYNIKRHGDRHWSANPHKALTIAQKISKANKGKPGYWKGKEMPVATKEKISKKLKGRTINYTPSQETRQKISENNKRLQREGKIGMRGKQHSEQTKMKIHTAHSGANNAFYGKHHTTESKEKIRQAGLGRTHTDQTKLLISIKATGHKRATPESIAASHTPDINKRRSEKLKGHGVSDETRAKMKAARLAFLSKTKQPVGI